MISCARCRRWSAVVSVAGWSLLAVGSIWLMPLSVSERAALSVVALLAVAVAALGGDDE